MKKFGQFLEKKKMDLKFRGTGQGHRMDEEKPRPKPSEPPPSQKCTVPSSSSAAAAQAALSRLEGGGGGRTGQPRERGHSPKTSTSAVARNLSLATATADDRLPDTVAGSSVIVNLVCPVCNRSFPHSEIHEHMNACLHEEYVKEPLSASVQMIHSLCRDVSKRQACIDTLCKYLDNIIDHPGEEKYRKIRTGNKTFTEKVSCVTGADLFMEAVGFRQKMLLHRDYEEQFYVLPLSDDTEHKGEGEGGGGGGDERLPVYRELLCSSEPLKPTLNRQVRLYRPSPRVTHFDLSDDFYQLSLEEIRREQKLKSEAVERSQVLRTKAMRERDEVRAVTKYYRFTVLRIRLPDGLFLQAMFRPREKLQTVREVISSVLTDGTLTYSLSAFGQLLTDDSETLALLGLVPSAVLNLSWNGAGPHSRQPYMEPGLLERIQQI